MALPPACGAAGFGGDGKVSAVPAGDGYCTGTGDWAGLTADGARARDGIAAGCCPWAALSKLAKLGCAGGAAVGTASGALGAPPPKKESRS